MAKPVIIIRVSGKIPKEDFERLKRDEPFDSLKGEYHILLVVDYSIEKDFEFECLNVKNSEKVDFKELQKHIDNSLK